MRWAPGRRAPGPDAADSGNILYCFTAHARERWEERIGGALPSNQDIERIIGESIVLQKFRRAFTSRGTPLVFLSIYWNVRRGVVMKVDEEAGKVVTVLGGLKAFKLNT